MLDVFESSGIYDEANDISTPVSEGLATRLTKSVTLPLQKEALTKIQEKYKPPSNASYAAVPRVEREVWHSLPARAGALDLQNQKLQLNVVKGMLPYAEIISNLQDMREERPKIWIV